MYLQPFKNIENSFYIENTTSMYIEISFYVVNYCYSPESINKYE